MSKMLSHRILDWWDVKCKEKEEIRHDSDVSCLGNWWKSRSNKIGKLEEWTNLEEEIFLDKLSLSNVCVMS